MPDRKMKDKSKPGLNFNLYLKLNFPISDTIANQIDFTTACFNKNTTKSNVLRKFLFELLEVKSEEEFNKLMLEPREYSKRYIKKIIKEKHNNTNFSELMKKKIKEFIDNEK